ncbi:MAG: thioredoxin domain-containing protein [Deltaproteobacteria bacterium]|nr:thioredoxin domain-containing protein [Deltaproteobacteria bacterium]
MARDVLRFFALSLVWITAAAQAAVGEATITGINWKPFNEQQFASARSQKKLLLLNLEAVWCHWCHVMEKETYSDPEVAQKLKSGFIAMKADQDSRPDLASRYINYGWPATIIFDSSGNELRKLAGYIEPTRFKEVLDEVIKDPSPKDDKPAFEAAFNQAGSLEDDYRESLVAKHYASLDMEKGGLRTSHRYIDADTLEYSLIRAARGSDRDSTFAKLTLDANRKLIDQVWGGVYQYSTKRGWDNPHFEKIMSSQAVNMKIYGLAYSLWNEEIYWQSASSVYQYLRKFMSSPEGAFYTSQDADLKQGQHAAGYFALGDAERRKLGVPAIDKSIYSSENGRAIGALTALYAATGNTPVLDDALRAASWIIKNRALPGGGFKHGEKDPAGPYLADTLAMAEAFLALYGSTGDRAWLSHARDAAGFIDSNFRESSEGKPLPGYLSDKSSSSSPLKPHRSLPENIRAVRFFNLLSHYTGSDSYKQSAKLAMQFVATPAYSSGDINDTGILLADLELTGEPLHITIVGQKDDPLAKELFMAGLKYFSPYKRLEWWDKREGAMPNPDVEYPQMQKSAAFICTNKRCSLPIFKPEAIPDTIKLFHKDLR